MSIAVVKANFGTRNSVFWHNTPKIDGVDYHYFTDSTDKESLSSLISRGVYVHEVNLNNCILDTPVGTNRFKTRRQAKLYKLIPDLFIANYEYYIWLDAYFELKINPVEIVKQTGLNTSSYNFAFFKHSARNCIYEEANIIKSINYDDQKMVDFQMMCYNTSFNYPTNNGLYECTCFAFKNNNRSKLIRLEWLNHINRFTSRDQLSLPFVLNLFNEVPSIIPGKILPGTLTDNPYFISGGNR